jgi:TDG/mug DNA glycosylase family protein
MATTPRGDSEVTKDLIGYQSREEWLGIEYLTLADVWPPAPRAAIVGLNPAPPSVAIGHYYQGHVGQRQMRRLAAAGLFDLPVGTRHVERAALAAGVGLTDLVKRPTAGERDISAWEVVHGRAGLETKLAALEVPLVICVFRHAVKALVGSEGRPGIQPNATSWGAQIFRMPGPFEAAEQADAVMDELRASLAGP